MEKAPHKRLTIDMAARDHAKLKMLSANLGLSMRDFVLFAVANEMARREDQIDLDIASQSKSHLHNNPSDLIAWDEVEKQLGWDEL